MPFVDLSRVQLFYTDTGHGNPLLLVHGFTADGSDWSFQTAELERSYRVINVDLRGHGRTSVPASGYDLADYVEDLTEFLRVLAPGPVVAIGHSIGASMVVTLAVEAPELVRAIVVVDGSYGFPEEARAVIEELSGLGRGPSGAENVVQYFGSNFYPAGTPSFLPAWHARRIRGLPPHVLAEGMGSLLGPGSFAFLPGCEAYLRRVMCPALAVRGGTNAVDGLTLERRTLVTEGSSFLACNDSGHWPHQTQPERVNQELLRWLGTV